jgi:hypothetical protein
LAKTDLVITLVIEDSTTIQKQGTITITRNNLAYLQAFKTTNASDTAYAIDHALRELAELERKEPTKSKPARSKTKSSQPRLDDKPEDDEDEAATEVIEDKNPTDLEDQTPTPELDTKAESDELHYNLITVTGKDQSPAAYKHAALLAEALRSQKLWNNTTQITFDNPVEAWTKLKADTLDLQDVLSLYASSLSSPAITTKLDPPPTSEHSTTQVNLI